jgi:hypothetical protein
MLKVIDKCIKKQLLPKTSVNHVPHDGVRVLTHLYVAAPSKQGSAGAAATATAAALLGPHYTLHFAADSARPILEVSPAAPAARDVGGRCSVAGFKVQVRHGKNISDFVASVWAQLLTIAVVMSQCAGVDAAKGLSWGDLG